MDGCHLTEGPAGSETSLPPACHSKTFSSAAKYLHSKKVAAGNAFPGWHIWAKMVFLIEYQPISVIQLWCDWCTCLPAATQKPWNFDFSAHFTVWTCWMFLFSTIFFIPAAWYWKFSCITAVLIIIRHENKTGTVHSVHLAQICSGHHFLTPKLHFSVFRQL